MTPEVWIKLIDSLAPIFAALGAAIAMFATYWKLSAEAHKANESAMEARKASMAKIEHVEKSTNATLSDAKTEVAALKETVAALIKDRDK